MDSIHYVQNIPIIQNTDVLVCGGGCAGIMAAIASARNGAATVLVERYGCVGGTATMGWWGHS
jgi:heterodisulfide reductase subunit A-like polyferredoxin